MLVAYAPPIQHAPTPKQLELQTSTRPYKARPIEDRPANLVLVVVEAVEGEVEVEEEMVGVVDGEAEMVLQVVGIIVSHQSKLILLKRV